MLCSARCKATASSGYSSLNKIDSLIVSIMKTFKNSNYIRVYLYNEGVNRSTVSILARILDSERNFNGSVDPMITADRGIIQILDFGCWEVRVVDFNVPPEISLSFFDVPDVTQ